MRYYLIVAISVIAFSLQSQTSLDDVKFNIFQNLNSSVNQNYIRLLNEAERLDERQLVFEFDDWQQAKLITQSDEEVLIDSCNFNIKDQTMFFQRKGSLYFLYPSQMKTIFFNEREFIPLPESNTPNSGFSYYEILSEGDINLLKYKSLEKKKVNNHPMGISSGIDKYKYSEKIKFYYSRNEYRKLELVPRNKKNFIKIFQRDRNRIVQYARENNISPKSEKDLKAIFDYYNSLKS
jgi:hypothetical protein